MLDLLTVEHVKQVWEGAYPSDVAVERLLEGARQVLAGERSPQWADETMERAWVDFLGRDESDPRFLARLVGRAACVTLFTAAHDKGYDGFPPETANYDLESDEWDASLLASLAHAGGEVGDPDADPERRRDFWRWYLTDAVPTAWRRCSEE